MTRKILLLGGTGAIGVYLCKYLAQEPDTQLYISSRSSKTDQGNIHYLQGNAKDLRFLQDTILRIKPDAIVDFMVWNTKQFAEVCPLLLKNAAHYLFLSSYRVFAEQNPLTEHSPRWLDVCKDETYLKTDEYALTKARQENILRQSGQKNWTILRPSITYSTNRFQFGCLEANTFCLRSFQGLPVIMPKEMLDKQTTLTWAGDTACLIEKLIFNAQAYGEDFNLATAEHHTWREIAGYYQEILGMRVQEISLTQYINVVGSSWQTRYDRMLNRTLDNSKVLAVTGTNQSQFMPLKKGLQQELSHFIKWEHFHPNIIINARIDRLCHSKMSLKGVSLKDRLRYYAVRCGVIDRLRKIKSTLKGK